MNTPLTRLSRLILWFVAVNALVGAAVLILFPERTEDLFFWPIAPPINAALFGALYLGGAMVVGWVAWGGQWEPARFLTPVLVSAGVFITISTLLHLDKFAPGLKLAYWLLVYIGAPLLALLIYRRQEARGADWSAAEPIRRPTRILATLTGVLLLILGLLAIAFPAPVVSAWPWPTSPLLVRIFASWFSAFGVGLLWFRIESDWRRVRLIPLMMVAAAALDLLMVFLHRGDIPTFGTAFWLFDAHLALFGVVGLLMWRLQR